MSSEKSAKTAVIFGGAGFIGTRLMSELLRTSEYDRIVSADLRPPSVALNGVEYVAVDVRSPIFIPGELPNVEIYNLAAVHTTPGHEDWEYFWTNVLGAIHVCAFAADIGCRRVVFLSSISVYGPSELPLDEEGPLRSESAYGRSKFQAEEIHRSWRKAEPGRRLVIVRPAVIFGCGERGNFTRMAALLRRRLFFYPGRSDTIKSCCYVGELVRSLTFVCGLGRDEITYNLAYPERYTTRDICRAFSDVAGYPPPMITVPLSLMMFAGLLFEVLGAAGISTSINRSRVLKLVKSTNIVPKTLCDLGYHFETDLREGLARWREDSPSREFT
jgi:nucleoside-diphosphate-sugar epimerase